MSKELTLDQLAGVSSTVDEKKTETIKNAKEISISDLAKNLPGREEEKIENPIIVDNALNSMKSTLQERKEFIEKEVMPIVEENAREIALEKQMEEMNITEEKVEEEKEITDIEDLEDEEESVPSYAAPDTFRVEEEKVSAPVKKAKVVKPSTTNELDEIDDLLKELEDSDDEFVTSELNHEETVEEARERFKESLKDIKVSSSSLDLSKFKIRKSPVASSTILNSITSTKPIKKADWVLYHTGKSITMSACDGPELDALKKTIANSNNVNGVIESLKMVYNHIIDPNKPSFEAWTKTTRTEDMESLFYALYKACYSDVNLVGRTCGAENCGRTSIINTDISKMVKFENNEIEQNFKKIFNQDTTSEAAIEESVLIVASDDIAISYKNPTLYSTFIQYSTLNPDIVKKYSETLNSMSYIDGFYKIDKENQELIPIEVKVYPNNLNKTVLSKIKVYIDILKTLTNDQYNILTSKLNNLIQDPKVTYIYPEDTCPECGTKLAEEPIDSMLNLLFTRAQLAQIKSL